MALVCEKGVITALAATGVQTYNLGSAFNGVEPKFLICWATYDTADGLTDGDGIFSLGFGTRDGGASQNVGICMFSDDTPTASATVQGNFSDAVLKGVIADGTAVDYVATLDSFVTGTPSQFKLNWTDFPASAIKVHYLVLGGSSLTAARAGSVTTTTAVATQDVTINTGWGQPDALLLISSNWNTAGITQTDAALGFGAATSDTDGRSTMFKEEDAANTMSLGSLQGAFLMQWFTAAVAKDSDAKLAAKASWPVDGFRLSYADQAGFAWQNRYLALKGITMKTGSGTAPTAGSPPVAQTLTGTAGATARAALVWTSGQIVSATAITTGTRHGQFSLGATDGTNEGVASIVEESANTASISGRDFTSAKIVRLLDAGNPPTLQAEADSGLSGVDATLSWNDIDSVATEYNWLILAESAPPPANLALNAASAVATATFDLTAPSAIPEIVMAHE
jgi:hypothetical protein